MHIIHKHSALNRGQAEFETSHQVEMITYIHFVHSVTHSKPREAQGPGRCEGQEGPLEREKTSLAKRNTTTRTPLPNINNYYKKDLHLSYTCHLSKYPVGR